MRVFHRKRYVSFFLCGFIVAWAGMAQPIHAATSKQVDAALEKARAYLFTLQNKNGTWDDTVVPPKPAESAANARSPNGGQWTGETALAVYALLAAGESPQNPKLKPAIEFLVRSETAGTYALGLRMQVWLLLPRKAEYLAAARRDAKVLLAGLKTQGTAAGMYSYVFGNDPTYSHSRSQYGVLGIWAAEQLGIEIPA